MITTIMSEIWSREHTKKHTLVEAKIGLKLQLGDLRSLVNWPIHKKG